MNWLAFAWGLAEATLFFIVPDVLLTFLARRGLRPALVGTVFALAGALLGGCLMYQAGTRSPEKWLLWMDHLPAIGPAMIEQVGRNLHRQGPQALLLGPLQGIPYKLFALQAPAAGIGLPAFLTVSVVARLARFLFSILLAWGILWALRRHWPRFPTGAGLTVFWIGFYAFYFTVMPG